MSDLSISFKFRYLRFLKTKYSQVFEHTKKLSTAVQNYPELIWFSLFSVREDSPSRRYSRDGRAYLPNPRGPYPAHVTSLRLSDWIPLLDLDTTTTGHRRPLQSPAMELRELGGGAQSL